MGMSMSIIMKESVSLIRMKERVSPWEEREGKPHKEWKDNHEHAYHCLNCVMFSWCRKYCSFYARHISMPKSFTGKELIYTSIV
jgi:radical SAM protein with 4Fe4S-binding SPASM domain